MATRTCAWNREIEHLGGKNKSPQHAHQGDFPIVGFFANVLSTISQQGAGNQPHHSTHGGG